MDIRHIVNAPDSSPSRNPKVEKGQAPIVIPGAQKPVVPGATDQVDIDRELRHRIAELTQASLKSPDMRQEKVARLRGDLQQNSLSSPDVFRATAEAIVQGELAMVASLDLNDLR